MCVYIAIYGVCVCVYTQIDCSLWFPCWCKQLFEVSAFWGSNYSDYFNLTMAFEAAALQSLTKWHWLFPREVTFLKSTTSHDKVKVFCLSVFNGSELPTLSLLFKSSQESQWELCGQKHGSLYQEKRFVFHRSSDWVVQSSHLNEASPIFN